uniref:Cationic amino acid transporter C-terminal domain-containing protein n=1 Tax=Alexandrium monilatum TaxID=311494 RepID=A0A7S4W6R6_9DINO
MAEPRAASPPLGDGLRTNLQRSASLEGAGQAMSLDQPLLRHSLTAPGRLNIWLEQAAHLHELPKMTDGELERRLGVSELTLLGIGACIGAGIFVLTGVEARIAGPSVGLAFLLAAVCSMFNGMCFSELASRLPVSGSTYLYTYCMFGELTALVVVVNQLVDYHIGAAAISRSIVAYVAGALDVMGLPMHDCLVGCKPFASMPWLDISLGAPAILGVVTIVVAGGAKTNATVTGVMTVLKVAIVIFVIVLGMDMVDTDRWVPVFPHGLSATLQAAATLNYAFIGYDVIANAAEECVNPQRHIPAAIIGALSCCGALYLAMCMVLCGMQEAVTIDVSAPVSSAFVQHGMDRVASVINVGAFVGMFTGLLAGVYGQSRIYFALARDHMVPSLLRGTPKCAVWCGTVASLLAMFLDLEMLASFLNIGVLVSYSSTAASVLVINSCCRKTEYCLLAVVSALAASLAVGPYFWPPLAGISAAALAGVIGWACLRRCYHCCPGGAFSCPGKPLTPLVALVGNVYLAAELSWHAWLRLLALGFLVVATHTLASFFGCLDAYARKRMVCNTVRSASKAAGTNPGVGGCR